MKTTSTQSFELSEDDVKEAVVEWLEKKFGKANPIVVTLGVHTIVRGIGYSEYSDYEVRVSAERNI